ncbi:hypothetical protein HRO26_06800 [Treponema pectinovorum]|uniref:hypothetical protein n=1 Tax=Treponema pectinovorum TaxID=164 RepID=UPI003D90724C
MSDQDLDPTIAALLAETANNASEDNENSTDFFGDVPVTDFTDSSFRKKEEDTEDEPEPNKVDLSVTKFKPITKFFEDEGHKYFDDASYYKSCLTGEAAPAQRVHQVLSKYLTCTDPKDRTVYRQQLVMAYWELVHTMAPKMADFSIPKSKRMMMRYGVLLPSLFTPEQKETFSKAILENNTGEPVYYMDEWFKEIASGRLSLSATDEVRVKKSNAGGAAEQQHLMQLKSKNDGKIQSSESFVNAKESERQMMETELLNRVQALCEHPAMIGMAPHRMPYSEMQKKLFVEIQERLRSLQKNDKELSSYLKELEEAKSISESLQAKMQSSPESVEVSKGDIDTEYNTVRQMAKMTIGRQGNQFPVFTREFYHCIPKGTGFRENVISIMSWIEEMDPGAFCRIHKNTPHRIVPYVLLVPTYGDFGFCWEPFDRYNRITSRGRIVVPMYPRDLKISILMAVADLRWQVAKEKASYYWMEEGLTGQYYQWIESQKLKGDLKSYFISDYVLWMTKEVEGVQRMEKDLRAIFWRFIPFSQERKDELKKRSLVYQELYQRDINRSMSDGY